MEQIKIFRTKAQHNS